MLTGFRGERTRVLYELQDDAADHRHVVRLVMYRFDDAEVPYLEVEEPPLYAPRVMAISTAVHALLNLGEMEIFQVGNRDPMALTDPERVTMSDPDLC